MTEKIALQFQPIRRPPQAKKNIKKTISSTSSSSTVSVQPHIVLQNVSSLDYWSHKDEDINESYDGTESRKAAKNRKKKKKIKDNEVEMILWDDPYDPFKPNDYEEYKMSDEAIQEMIDWKNKKEGKTNVDDTEKYKNIGTSFLFSKFVFRLSRTICSSRKLFSTTFKYISRRCYSN